MTQKHKKLKGTLMKLLFKINPNFVKNKEYSLLHGKIKNILIILKEM